MDRVAAVILAFGEALRTLPSAMPFRLIEGAAEAHQCAFIKLTTSSITGALFLKGLATAMMMSAWSTFG